MGEQHDAWKRTRAVHQGYAGFYRWFGGASIIVAALGFGAVLFTADRFGYGMNAYTEAVSVAFTIFVLNTLAKQRSDRERREELIALMGSEDNSTALQAVRLLRHKGWLTDGSLEWADLSRSNLTQARLEDANLRGVDLSWANLDQASLQFVNLEKANVSGAQVKNSYLIRTRMENAVMLQINLKDADLTEANLKESYLSGANLQGASLRKADLRGAKLAGEDYYQDELYKTPRNEWHYVSLNVNGADMTNAFLVGASLANAKLTGEGTKNTVLNNATLPDGSKWTPETDMARFTDPNHPNFWEPDWVKHQRESDDPSG